MGYTIRAVDHGSHTSPTKTAVQATLHCLTGCAIGEVLGMIVATAAGWGNASSIALSVVLAFFFGYLLTARAVLAAGVGPRKALSLALASDTVSIATMEVVDNGFILLVPGAIAAGLDEALFWWSLGTSLVIAFLVTVPVNRWLIGRGKGHAVMHELHGHAKSPG
jgi:Zn-dependent protease